MAQRSAYAGPLRRGSLSISTIPCRIRLITPRRPRAGRDSDPGAFRGSSDFDIRHLINANAVYEMPFGKGKTFLKNSPGWLDAMVGGWQVSSIMRFNTGLPTVV